VLIAPPPVNEHLWWPRDESNGHTTVSRTAAATKEYADAACEVGAKLNIPVINLWKAFMEKAAFQVDVWKTGDHLPGSLAIPQDDALVKLMYDGEVLDRHTHLLANSHAGLHFNPAGYDILFQELTKLIAERWPDQVAETLPMVLPAWNDANAWEAWEKSQDLK
jgi:lysophospholipase L1-like esterase